LVYAQVESCPGISHQAEVSVAAGDVSGSSLDASLVSTARHGASALHDVLAQHNTAPALQAWSSTRQHVVGCGVACGG
jgi:hypothetical protein